MAAEPDIFQGLETERLRADLLFAARFLARELGDIWGHVTARIPDGSGFLLKHLRIPQPEFDPDEVMAYDFDGLRRLGKQDDPWEIPIYTATYAARPDAGSVVHLHPPVATALSAAGTTVYALTHDGFEFEDGLPMTEGDLIDTVEKGQAMAEALGRAAGCMLKGHGVVVVGTTVRHAAIRALAVEKTAKQIMWASSVGEPSPLPQRIRDHITERRGGGEPELWRYLEWLEQPRD